MIHARFGGLFYAPSVRNGMENYRYKFFDLTCAELVSGNTVLSQSWGTSNLAVSHPTLPKNIDSYPFKYVENTSFLNSMSGSNKSSFISSNYSGMTPLIDKKLNVKLDNIMLRNVDGFYYKINSPYPISTWQVGAFTRNLFDLNRVKSGLALLPWVTGVVDRTATLTSGTYYAPNWYMVDYNVASVEFTYRPSDVALKIFCDAHGQAPIFNQSDPRIINMFGMSGAKV